MSSIFSSAPLSHDDYVNYFKGLAENNKEILHSEQDPAFVELLDSEGPYQYLDVSEFEEQIKELKNTFMALQSFRARLNDRENASTEYMIFGAFLIMKKIPSDDFTHRQTRSNAIDNCQRISEQILGYMKEEADHYGLEEGALFELKSEIGNIVVRTHSCIGKRVDFQYIRGAESVNYNENDWVNPLA